MATTKKTFATQTTQAALVRMDPDYVTRAMMAGGTGTLEIGTAVAWDSTTGFWEVWDGDGSAATGQNKIEGFVYETITLLGASKETLGAVMTAGEVHYDDVLAVNVGTTDIYGTTAEFTADLKILAIRQLNLRVVGLAGTPE